MDSILLLKKDRFESNESMKNQQLTFVNNFKHIQVAWEKQKPSPIYLGSLEIPIKVDVQWSYRKLMKILKRKVLGISQERKTILKTIFKKFLESFKSNLHNQDDKETAEFIGYKNIVPEQEDVEEAVNISWN